VAGQPVGRPAAQPEAGAPVLRHLPDRRAVGRLRLQAQSQPAPDADRAQSETLLTEMDGSARHFRAAQTALAPSDQPAYQEAQAQREFGSADAAAQRYGMPPLKTCPHHESTTPPPAPSPSTLAPAAAWQPRHASLTAVQQASAALLAGKIWLAGGLTKSTTATASTQIYDRQRTPGSRVRRCRSWWTTDAGDVSEPCEAVRN
jgi:hypothetical protein